MNEKRSFFVGDKYFLLDKALFKGVLNYSEDGGPETILSSGWPTDRGYQEHLSNRPAVLLSKGRGAERTRETRY